MNRVVVFILALAIAPHVLAQNDRSDSVGLESDGTAGAPAIYWTGDGDSGLFRSSADDFALVVNGTERLGITTNGPDVTGNIIFRESTNDLTLVVNDQVSSSANATIPDLGGTNSTIAFLEQSQTFTASQTFDTGASANPSLDETGFSFSTGSAETFNIQNTGSGSVNVQEDGTNLVDEGRSISTGTGLSGGGDLSTDRTFNLDAATSDLTDAASPNLTSEGQILIWDDNQSRFENQNLTPGDGIEIINGNASIDISTLPGNFTGDGLTTSGSPTNIEVGSGTAITVNSDDIQVESSGITTTELDLSISPSWTGTHDFTGGGIDLPSGAVDAIGEIASGNRTGSDTSVVTGTSASGGNLVEWNADGDAVDSGTATSNVTTGGARQTISFGSTFDATGNFAVANGSAGDADASSGGTTKHVVEAGTIDTLTLFTNGDLSTNNGTFKIHKNGSSQTSVTATGGSGSGETFDVSVSVSAGDIVELEWDAGSTNPGNTTASMMIR